MYVSFEQLASSARIWVYQSDRALNSQEQEQLLSAAQNFCNEWNAHKAALASSATILHNRFLILAVDESVQPASGCSIDSSVAFVKQAEKALGITFFDRTKLAFIQNGEVFVEDLSDIRNLIAQGRLTADTLTFNNLVSSKNELETTWKVRLADSWLKRYLVHQ
jgi:hypothetical protein